VAFTEGLLRSIILRTGDQQLDLVQDLAASRIKKNNSASRRKHTAPAAPSRTGCAIGARYQHALSRRDQQAGCGAQAIAEQIGWSRENVRDSIDGRAWAAAGETFRSAFLVQSEGAAPSVGAAAPFTAGSSEQRAEHIDEWRQLLSRSGTRDMPSAGNVAWRADRLPAAGHSIRTLQRNAVPGHHACFPRVGIR
jgi:hypothetical protein